MSKPISFISEHTAEFFLLADLMPMLSTQFKTVIPFYFWSSREGSKMSIACSTDKKYHSLVIYPRRPKVAKINANEIVIKFNYYISSFIQHFMDNKMPVVSGVPESSSFFDLDWNNQSCHWFQFIGPVSADIEYSIKLNSTDTLYTLKDTFVKGPIPKSEISEILKSSETKNWETIIEIIRTSRHTAYDNSGYRVSPFGWYGNYKPIFIIASD